MNGELDAHSIMFMWPAVCVCADGKCMSLDCSALQIISSIEKWMATSSHPYSIYNILYWWFEMEHKFVQASNAACMTCWFCSDCTVRALLLFCEAIGIGSPVLHTVYWRNSWKKHVKHTIHELLGHRQSTRPPPTPTTSGHCANPAQRSHCVESI